MLLEKGKETEAYEMLTKAISKDTLASAEQYVLSFLLNNEDSEKYDLDSAYYYILLANGSFEAVDEKSQGKLVKNGFTRERYNLLKQEIEKRAFIRAKKKGLEDDYIAFISEFTTSVYIDSAIILRNVEAFHTAEKLNTISSYKNFFTTYPEAADEHEATKRYELLLYKHETSDGKLNSYRQFVINYPSTWHRKEVERHIYNIITGKNSVESYSEFITEFPDSYLRTQASLVQYSILPDDQKQYFLEDNKLHRAQIDSILILTELSNQLLTTVHSEQNYQVISSIGTIIIDSLDNVSKADKCGSRIRKVVLASSNNVADLMALDGSILASGKILSVADEGMGIYKIITHEAQYFINETGLRSNHHYFEKAYRVGPFLAYLENSKWGLESVTGIKMLKAKFDSISSFNGYILFNKGKKWSFLKNEELYPTLDGEEVELKLKLDNISVMDQHHLILSDGKKTSLIDENGNTLVPFQKQTIELVDGGFFVDREDSILDSRVSNKWYKDIRSNDVWTIGELENSSEVYFNTTLYSETERARIVGSSVIVISKNDSIFAYFNDSSKIYIAPEASILPVNRMGMNSSLRHYVLTSPNAEPIVYNKSGTKVNIKKFEKLIDLGHSYILSKNKGSFELLNNNGGIVLEDIDAGTSLENGYISFLKEGKFGLVNFLDSTLIEAKYSKPLKSYSDKLFITNVEGKFGIIDRTDSMLVPANYSEIKYLNDSIAILNNNFRWIFWDIYNRQALLDNVSDYWVHDLGGRQVFKILKGIGYGIWSASDGVVLNSTFSEINILSKGLETMYVAEKWVEEADLVIMLYYDKSGRLFRKNVLSTAQYNNLTCQEVVD